MNTPSEKIHEGEDATLFTQLVDRANGVTANLFKNQIEWYYSIGEVFDDFCKAEKHKKLGSRTVAHFSAALSTTDLPVGESTLYHAKAIYNRYDRTKINDLVATGLRIGHLKALAGCSDDAVAKISPKLIGPDGKVVTIEKLTDLINAHKQAVAKGEIAAVRGDAPPPAANVETSSGASKPGLAEEDLFAGSEGDKTESGAGHEAEVGSWSASESTETNKPKGDDGKTGTVGAGHTKEFTKPPLKALKAVDNTATKLQSLYADAFLAVKEAGKVGFDGEKAQQNYQLALSNALTALVNAVDCGKELVEVMRAGVSEQQGPPSGSADR